MGSVLRVGTQGSMPGLWRGLGASSAIVLEATGGILLAEWEAEKHCEMEPSSPLPPLTPGLQLPRLRCGPILALSQRESPRSFQAEPP